MAVHRRGLGATTSKRTSLGRLLVTIDDLDALAAMLVNYDNSDPPVLEFSGGTIDAGEDLRALSDDELKSLTIKTKTVEIALGRDRATCVGDADLVTLIDSRWASMRHTKLRPAVRLRDHWPFPAIASTVALGLAALGSAEVADSASRPIAENTTFAIITILTFLIGIVAVIAIIFRYVPRTFRPRSYALIKPITLQEHRREESSSRRHWQNAAIALGGVVVALVAALIATLSGK